VVLCATRGAAPTDVVRARASAAQHDKSIVRLVIQAALDEEVVGPDEFVTGCANLG